MIPHLIVDLVLGGIVVVQLGVIAALINARREERCR